MSKGPMSFELFSCAGGMAEGFRRAGILFDLTFDHDSDACDSYEANLGHRPIQMDVRDLLRMARAGWRPGPIELLVADPPCTPWSMVGKRKGLDDERDMMRATCELVALLRPATYLIGNVPGLQHLPNKRAVHETIGALTAHGYCVDDHATLDATAFGVPQHRKRPFWFGHLSGPCIRWPTPTHADPQQLAHPVFFEPGLRPWITCRDALGHLSLEEMGKPVRLRYRGVRATTRAQLVRAGGKAREAATLGEPAPTIRVRAGAALVINDKHPIPRPDEPSMTIAARDGRGAQGALALEWPWDRPATTVTQDDRLPAPGHHGSAMLSAPDAILLSERAHKILQGFPESWIVCGRTKRSRSSQVGQAMPPALAEAVARAIVSRSF